MSIIALIFLLFISIITNILYYKPLFVKSNTDILKKGNTLTDLIFLLTKIAINTLFALDKNTEEDHWIIILFFILFSGINAYFIIFYESRANILLSLLNKTFSFILLFSSISLLIGKIFKFTQFDGLMTLLFITIILIIIYILLYKNMNFKLLFVDYMKINNPEEYLNFVSKYYIIFINRNKTRNSELIFKTLISSIEEKCLILDCPLKRYISNLKKGIDNQYFLINYCDILFKYGISKFPNDTYLKINYTGFLLLVMNNIKKALLILDNIKENYLSLRIGYNIHLYRNLIIKYKSNIIEESDSIFQYKNEVKNFKDLIKKEIVFYRQFISLLLNYKYNNNNNNFKKIDNIGQQVIYYKKEIEEFIKKIKNMKTNCNEIIKLYSEYGKIMLNNQEDNQNIEIDNIYNADINEIDYLNLNAQIFKEKDEIYLLVSGDKKKLGEIIDCSISFSKIFGYKKEEIIEKNINVLIPEIFHNKHNSILLEQSNKDQLEFFEILTNQKKYNSNYIEKEIYCVTKSKFLIPLKIKIYPAKTSENNIIYIVNASLINIKEYKNSEYCILTDQNFIIKSFTVNCLEHLNLQYQYINSNIYIINYIKQFQEYLIENDEIDSKSSFISSKKNNIFSLKDKAIDKYEKEKLSNNNISTIITKLVKYLINKKSRITWKINMDNNLNHSNFGIKKKKNKKSMFIRRASKASLMLKLNDFKENDMDINLHMKIKKIAFNNEPIGYYFFFEKINDINNEEHIHNCERTSSNIHNDYIPINNYIPNKKIMFKNVKYNSDIVDSNENRIKIKRANSEMVQNLGKAGINKNSKLNKIRLSNKAILKTNINISNNFDINDNYIPNFIYQFSFNLNKFSYELSKDIKNNIKLNEILKNESLFKVNSYYEELHSKQNKQKNPLISSSMSEYENQNDTSNSNSYSESSSSSSSSSKSSDSSNKVPEIKTKPTNFNIGKSITMKFRPNKRNSKINSIINTSKTMKPKSKNNNNKNLNDVNSLRVKSEQKKEINYYKVNLNKIHFMIFDFNKEMIVEKNKKNISKIDEILKNKNYTNFEKDSTYPFFSFQNNKSNIKKTKKNEDNKNTFNKLNKIDEEKLFEYRIMEAINMKKDEIPIKKIKRISIISFFILLICDFLSVYLSLGYYSPLQKFMELFKNTIAIKYCNIMSVYYIKELSLLNFNMSNIIGGEYVEFPSKNITKYKILLAEQLMDLYLESHNCIKNIIASSLSISKNSSIYLTELFLDISILYNQKTTFIHSDLYGNLIQYNNIFYSLAFSSVDIHQSNSDLINFNENSLNSFRKTINIFTDIYISEINNIIKKLKISYIISLIIFLLIFAGIYILIYLSFLSANKRRLDYMEIFYGINENILKVSIINCQNLINKLENYNNNKFNEKEEDSSDYIDNNSFIQINLKENNNNKTNSFINNNKTKLNNLAKNRFYIIIFGLSMLILYCFFILNCSYIFKKTDEAVLLYTFFQTLGNFQLNFVEIFNTYRQFIFDDRTIAPNNKTILNSLEELMINSYDSITQEVDFIQTYIAMYVPMNEEMIALYSRSICSFYITDYFSSTEECINKYKNIVKYDFNIFYTYFIQDIRISKNIAIYLLSTGNIRGELNEFNVDSWMEDELIPKKDKPIISNEIQFRLNLFNNDTLHTKLNEIFINIIMPYLDVNRKVLLNNLSLKDDIYFIIISSLYFSFLFILFYIYWIPIIIFFNKNIYKTKNMLSIIPTNILIYKNNVEILRDLFENKD